LAGRAVRIVLNPDYRQGDMLSSIRCGLRAIPENCEAVLVALGDQPGITAELVDRVIECARLAEHRRARQYIHDANCRPPNRDNRYGPYRPNSWHVAGETQSVGTLAPICLHELGTPGHLMGMVTR
jgi:hypothetical protein